MVKAVFVSELLAVEKYALRRGTHTISFQFTNFRKRLRTLHLLMKCCEFGMTCPVKTSIFSLLNRHSNEKAFSFLSKVLPIALFLPVLRHHPSGTTKSRRCHSQRLNHRC